MEAEHPVVHFALLWVVTCLHLGVSTAEDRGFALQLLQCEVMYPGSAHWAPAKAMGDAAAY